MENQNENNSDQIKMVKLLARIFEVKNSISKILKFSKGMSFDDFKNNELIKDAVIKNFLIIGEICNQLPDEIKRKNNCIPWNEIVGMRNRLIHEYDKTNDKILFDTISNHIPKLLDDFNKMYLDYTNSSNENEFKF